MIKPPATLLREVLVARLLLVGTQRRRGGPYHWQRSARDRVAVLAAAVAVIPPSALLAAVHGVALLLRAHARAAHNWSPRP
ncbi:hypothetical protein ABZV91_31810 [Nocardia sp. NPDC004568]|uniref:hypothetical protein n=1 Tax=Nocardia sp. NPDC004568 TaxID=3154551 RepID=UPI0033BCFC56